MYANVNFDKFCVVNTFVVYCTQFILLTLNTLSVCGLVNHMHILHNEKCMSAKVRRKLNLLSRLSVQVSVVLCCTSVKSGQIGKTCNGGNVLNRLL